LWLGRCVGLAYTQRREAVPIGRTTVPQVHAPARLTVLGVFFLAVAIGDDFLGLFGAATRDRGEAGVGSVRLVSRRLGARVNGGVMGPKAVGRWSVATGRFLACKIAVVFRKPLLGPSGSAVGEWA
jgi:hypothetical protein